VYTLLGDEDWNLVQIVQVFLVEHIILLGSQLFQIQVYLFRRFGRSHDLIG
jgi:hypothetical protein